MNEAIIYLERGQEPWMISRIHKLSHLILF